MLHTPTWPTTTALPMQSAVQPPATEPHAHDALHAGTRLDEFEVVRVLGAGGFGIVYLALDHVLLRYVAVKEYMPTALAGRGEGPMVSVRSAALAATFAAGLESFFNEARMLASFDHPSLVKVYRFWKANGTAYMVMPYYAGSTLKETRRSMSAAPDEAWLRALVEPLLGALEVLHGEGVYHRDIAPDNILLLPDGRPVLLDFGSARRVIGDRTQSLTAILKPNFAPVEQYADEAGLRQGPWTDLYALGATVHYMLTGTAPTPAVMRAVRDALPVLAAPAGAPTPFLAAIDWTLALAPDDRPQDVASVRRAFRGEVVPPRPTRRHVPAFRPAVGDIAAAASGATTQPATRPAASAATRPSRIGRRKLFAMLAALMCVAVGSSLWLTKTSSAGPSPRTEAQEVAELPQSLADTPPPVAPVAPVQQESIRDPALPVPATLRAAASKTPAPARPSRTPAEASATRAVPGAGSSDSPKTSCGNINFFSLALCVHRECAKPQWQAHAQCVDARRTEELRQRRMEQ